MSQLIKYQVTITDMFSTINRQRKINIVLVARSHRIAVMEDRVQALSFVVELSCAGSISHFGRRK